MRAVLVLGAILATFGAVVLFSVPTAAYIDYDCADFSTQEEAQAEYESNYGDPYRLDGDDDGVACEALPSESDYSGYDDYDYDYDSSYDSSSSYDTEYDTSSFASASDPSESSSSGDGAWGWLWLVILIGAAVIGVATDR